MSGLDGCVNSRILHPESSRDVSGSCGEINGVEML